MLLTINVATSSQVTSAKVQANCCGRDFIDIWAQEMWQRPLRRAQSLQLSLSVLHPQTAIVNGRTADAEWAEYVWVQRRDGVRSDKGLWSRTGTNRVLPPVSFPHLYSTIAPTSEAGLGHGGIWRQLKPPEGNEFNRNLGRDCGFRSRGNSQEPPIPVLPSRATGPPSPTGRTAVLFWCVKGSLRAQPRSPAAPASGSSQPFPLPAVRGSAPAVAGFCGERPAPGEPGGRWQLPGLWRRRCRSQRCWKPSWAAAWGRRVGRFCVRGPPARCCSAGMEVAFWRRCT